MQLQKRLEKGFEKLQDMGLLLFCKLNIETRFSKGAVKYIKKQPCDYIVITRENTWGIDAKECSAKVWYPKKAPAHQRDYLRWMQDNRKKGAFVVWFKKYNCMRVITDFASPAKPDSGIAFDWELFLL